MFDPATDGIDFYESLRSCEWFYALVLLACAVICFNTLQLVGKNNSSGP